MRVTLLKGLSNEEVIDRVREAMDAIYERYGSRVDCEIRDMAPELDAGEVAAATRFALRRAAAGWDPGAGAKFDTYWKRAVRNAILTAKRDRTKERRKRAASILGCKPDEVSAEDLAALGDALSLEGPARSGDDEEISVGDTVAGASGIEDSDVSMTVAGSDYMQRMRVERALDAARATIGTMHDPAEWVAEILGSAGWAAPKDFEQWGRLVMARKLQVLGPVERGDLEFRKDAVGIVLDPNPKKLTLITCDGSVVVENPETVKFPVRWRHAI